MLLMERVWYLMLHEALDEAEAGGDPADANTAGGIRHSGKFW